MSVPKVATLQHLLAHHERTGTKPKCSVFHLLPNRLVMDIIKIALDRQRDIEARKYHEQRYDAIKKVIAGDGWVEAELLECDIRHCGAFNRICHNPKFNPAGWDDPKNYSITLLKTFGSDLCAVPWASITREELARRIINQ